MDMEPAQVAEVFAAVATLELTGPDDRPLLAHRQEKRKAVAMGRAALDGFGWDEPGCAQVDYRRVANGLLAVLQIGPDGTPRSPETLA